MSGACTDTCARGVTDKVFEECGWSLTCDGERLVAYAMKGDPYNEFSIMRGSRVGRGFKVSVPLPSFGVQYITTMNDFTDACAFLRVHLEYFMETNA